MGWDIVLTPLAAAIISPAVLAVRDAWKRLTVNDKSQKMRERLDELTDALGDVERLKAMGLDEWAGEFEQDAFENAVRPLAQWHNARRDNRSFRAMFVAVFAYVVMLGAVPVLWVNPNLAVCVIAGALYVSAIAWIVGGYFSWRATKRVTASTRAMASVVRLRHRGIEHPSG